MGEKTLRSYTVPLNLGAFDKYNWLTDDAAMERIADRLGEIRKVRLLTPRMIANLSPVDPRSPKAGLIGSVDAGLYKPPRKTRS
jgi:hypothetical protein